MEKYGAHRGRVAGHLTHGATLGPVGFVDIISVLAVIITLTDVSVLCEEQKSVLIELGRLHVLI